MSEMSPHKGSAVWAMLLTVVVAWAACGVYRWRVPPHVEARAVVQVPMAADLDLLCRQPGLLQAAKHKLAEIPPDARDEQPGSSPLFGKLAVRKIKHDASHSQATTQHGETESWEITYRTAQSERALAELSALITVLEQRVLSNAEAGADIESHEISPDRVQELEDERLKAELQLEELADHVPPQPDAGELSNSEQSGPPAEVLAEVQSERLLMEEEWSLVQQELQASSELETVAAKLTPGPLKEAILQLDRRRKLSMELTTLNETEHRLGGIYGDRHPKLIEVRRKFDQVLGELGGWDEVVDQRHFSETLKSTVESLIALKHQEEADLRLQMELEQEVESTTDETARQRALLTRQLESLRQELATAQGVGLAENASSAVVFATLQAPHMTTIPWYFNLGVLFGLTTVCGLIAGKLIHKAWPIPDDEDDSDLASPPMPSFVAAPEAQLDLAQRRAVRQARLQQAYAA